MFERGDKSNYSIIVEKSSRSSRVPQEAQVILVDINYEIVLGIISSLLGKGGTSLCPDFLESAEFIVPSSRFRR